jgi:hypothetical protein
MSSKKQDRSPRPAGNQSAEPLDEEEQPTKTTTPRQDFIFAVKFFGIAALVVFAFWWLDRFV